MPPCTTLLLLLLPLAVARPDVQRAGWMDDISMDDVGDTLVGMKDWLVGVYDWGDDVVTNKLPILRTKVDRAIDYMTEAYAKAENTYDKISDKLEPLRPYYDDFMEFRGRLIDAGLEKADELTDEWAEKLTEFNDAGGFEALTEVRREEAQGLYSNKGGRPLGCNLLLLLITAMTMCLTIF